MMQNYRNQDSGKVNGWLKLVNIGLKLLRKIASFHTFVS